MSSLSRFKKLMRPWAITAGSRLPAASVSGLYFAHPEAKYFAVGPVGEDQVRDYAQRWGEPIEEAELWLEHGLGYTPSR